MTAGIHAVLTCVPVYVIECVMLAVMTFELISCLRSGQDQVICTTSIRYIHWPQNIQFFQYAPLLVRAEKQVVFGSKYQSPYRMAPKL